MSRLWALRDRNFGSIPGGQEIFLSSTASGRTLGPTQPHIKSLLAAFSPGVTRSRRVVDHLSLFPWLGMSGGIPPSSYMSS